MRVRTYGPADGRAWGAPAVVAARARKSVAIDAVEPGPLVLAAILLLHLPLGNLMRSNPTFAQAHVFGCLAFALWVAAASSNRSVVACAVAYIAGVEVLWRMTGAGFFWELGKYSVAVILGVALLRHPGRTRLSRLAILSFALLIPATLLTLSRLGFTDHARGQISFNLSGPFALSLCVLFFSSAEATERGIRSVLWWMIAALSSVAGLATYATATATATFVDESNRLTSGGFGPNQVSGVLGLGSALAAILVVTEVNRFRQSLAALIFCWMITQSALTFSRGGIVGALACLALWGLHAIGQPGLRARVMLTASAVLATASFVVVPWLESYTAGMMQVRFGNVDTTHRTELIEDDLRTWLTNPLFGVGPGLAAEERRSPELQGVGAHTEFSRLLAEHGVLGLASLVLMVVMGWRAYRSAGSYRTRAWTAGLLGWCVVTLSHSAFRVVAIPLVFGLATVLWRREPTTTGAFDHGARRRPSPMRP